MKPFEQWNKARLLILSALCTVVIGLGFANLSPDLFLAAEIELFENEDVGLDDFGCSYTFLSI